MELLLALFHSIRQQTVQFQSAPPIIVVLLMEMNEMGGGVLVGSCTLYNVQKNNIIVFSMGSNELQ